MNEKKIHSAMVAIMREVDAIGKDKRNQQQGFQYRGIDDAYNALHRIMAKHGVFCTTEVLDRHREERTNAKGTVIAFTICRIRFSFWADDGSSVSSIIDGEGMDSGDKSTNKALAIAHKYALLQAFLIPTEDMPDPDAEVHQVQPAKSGLSDNALADHMDAIAMAVNLNDLKAAYAAAYKAARDAKDAKAASRFESAKNERKAVLERSAA